MLGWYFYIPSTLMRGYIQCICFCLLLSLDDFTKEGSDWHKTLDRVPVGKRRIIMRVQGLILAQVLNYAQTGSTAPLMLLCGLGLVALGS